MISSRNGLCPVGAVIKRVPSGLSKEISRSNASFVFVEDCGASSQPTCSIVDIEITALNLSVV